MNNISFKSKITPVDMNRFYKETQKIKIKNYVDSPWTIKESVLNRNAYTTDVLDCTTCGITDGARVLLMHLCPTMKENEKFSDIIRFIESKIKGMHKENGLHGFVLGAQETKNQKSSEFFDKIIDFLESNNIPTSSFKYGNVEHHVAYSSDKDEWLIANSEIDNLMLEQESSDSILKRFFKEINISEYDEV